MHHSKALVKCNPKIKFLLNLKIPSKVVDILLKYTPFWNEYFPNMAIPRDSLWKNLQKILFLSINFEKNLKNLVLLHCSSKMLWGKVFFPPPKWNRVKLFSKTAALAKVTKITKPT